MPQEEQNEVNFLGRETELEVLKSFVKSSPYNIFGLYGTPMIGKTTLVDEFVDTEPLLDAYEIIWVQFEQGQSPEKALLEALERNNKELANLSFEKPTLFLIENFELCLVLTGNSSVMHSIQGECAKIKTFLKQVDTLTNIKVILESRFQLNTVDLGIHRIATLPDVELKGVETQHFKELYLQKGFTSEEFDAICHNFSNHTWLLSMAHAHADSIYRKKLHKMITRPSNVTTYLWTLLEEILSKLPRAELLLLCGLIIKNVMDEKEIEEAFEDLEAFSQTMVSYSIDSLEQKFLIQEKEDLFTINPYLREVCFYFMQKQHKEEIEFLRRMDYFNTDPLPQYSIPRQLLERGHYSDFYNYIRRLRKDRNHKEAHKALNYAIDSDHLIERAQLFNEIAITYKEQGEHGKAIAALDRAFEIEPDRVESLNELALIYKKEKRYEEAIVILKRSLTRRPNDVKTLNVLAITYTKVDDFDNALKIVEQGLKLEWQEDYFKNTREKIFKSMNEFHKNKYSSKPKRTNLKKLLANRRIKDFLEIALIRANMLDENDLVQQLQHLHDSFSTIEHSRDIGKITTEEYFQKIFSIATAISPIHDKLDASYKDAKNTSNSTTKILWLTATPANTNPLSLEGEYNKINKKLQEAAQPNQFILKPKEQVNLTEFKEQIELFNPHILHFSGHGDQKIEGQQQGGIALQNEHKNDVAFLSALKLHILFEYFKEDLSIELVILNCCYSAEQALAIAKHVPYVIGTTRAITNQQAIKFSEGFYFKYVQTNNIIRSFRSGIATAEMAGAAKIDFILYKDGNPIISS